MWIITTTASTLDQTARKSSNNYRECDKKSEHWEKIKLPDLATGKVCNSNLICPGDKIIESCTRSIFSSQHNRIGIGVSSLANKLHLASKNLQNKHLITVGTGFGNTRAPKTHHTMRNSRRLARYKAHGFFLATRRHWDALTKHSGSINYKNEMERT